MTGGWGIDALLQEQTRLHKDLDIIMLVDDVVTMRDLLERAGYGLKELSPEQSRDMELLRERLEGDYPDGHSHIRRSGT